MSVPDDLVPVGRIAGAYGVRGWVKVFSETDPPENLLQYAPWYLQDRDGGWQARVVREGRVHAQALVARLEGCADRDAAAALGGTTVAVPRSAFGALGEDEYYWADLVGLEVVNTEGTRLGTVERLFPTGANDVLVVRGERERLIPFTPGHAVVEVDLERRRLTVAWDPEF
ncbi:MAG TPA: ribosome maturation factor RimM [Gammaproteobacteria bacterium]